MLQHEIKNNTKKHFKPYSSFSKFMGAFFLLFFLDATVCFFDHDLQFLPVKQAVFGQNFPKEKGLGAFANLLVGSSRTKAGN